MKKVYILLPVHNRIAITDKFIQCLTKQTYTNYHLILIDDGSSDGTEKLVSQEISSLTVIKGQGNWWWAGSLSQGYQWLKHNVNDLKHIVLIINDDTTFDNDFLEIAVNILSRSYKTLLLAQCYSQANREILDVGTYVNWKELSFQNAPNINNINCLSTRGLFFDLEDFLAIGGFYPKLLPHYLSDYEFTIRADRKGYKLVSNPSLKLFLDENATGNHQINYNVDCYKFIRQIFSKKASSNPLAFSVFIILACPPRWKLLNLYRIWRGFFNQCYIFLIKRLEMLFD